MRGHHSTDGMTSAQTKAGVAVHIPSVTHFTDGTAHVFADGVLSRSGAMTVGTFGKPLGSRNT